MSVLEWIGLAVYGIPAALGLLMALFLGILAGGFTGDYSNSGLLATWNMIAQFTVVAAIALTWPVSVPAIALYDKVKKK
ncbi:hypothetical protein SEA_FAUST_186 [Streptomyces phage Faust]|uniref:Uncharacterized protein n=1 Tax=Streptomyces phage Faust TaxID=2767565 RepID=A0A7G9UZ03_9CAUD|nr:hypothetical protein PP456_gp101 [Streptomyces phage Faust]QNN99258.1 hypothetical protein SEA_FAUST_186 [Streptomyces phage Faust]